MKLLIFVFLLSGVLASENDLMKKRMTRMEDQLDRFSASMDQMAITLSSILKENAAQQLEIVQLKTSIEKKDHHSTDLFESSMEIGLSDSDLEQRVQILEIQVSEVQDEIGILGSQLTAVEADQDVQDQRILDVEDDVELVGSGLLTTQGNVVELDSRVVELESQNGTGSDVTEELAELDTRLDALELDGTVAFHVTFSQTDPIIPFNSIAVFDLVNVNFGDGYNMETGEFTVPSGGAGLYYFYAHFLFRPGTTLLNIRRNTDYLCAAYEDNNFSGDFGGGSCGAVVQLVEGDIIDVFHEYNTDANPVVGLSYRSSFSGFRIAPA